MKRALVLSGGGAKGSYQIGVWKALRRLNIKIDIVTGTSIGSINGALFVSNRYYRAKKLWLNMTTSSFFDAVNDDADNIFKQYKDAVKEVVLNKGMKLEKAEKLLHEVLNEDEIRNSKIDYGLVTVSYKTKQPKMLRKDDILYGKLLDYIMASATCFPAIEKKQIDGEYYIDGGYYDNLPINLAIEMGATNIIAVDLSAIGIKQKVKDKNVEIEIIRNSNKKMFTLAFTKKEAEKNIAYGYNDTMKHFKRLEGDKYTFYKGQLNKNYNSISGYYTKLLKSILLVEKNKVISEIFKITKYHKIFSDIKNNKKIDDVILEAMEYLGSLFEIPNEKIYTANMFNRILIKKVKTLSYIKISTKLKGKMLIGYFYNKCHEEKLSDNVKKELFNLALIFPKDFLAALYLLSIKKEYPITLMTDNFYQDLLKVIKK